MSFDAQPVPSSSHPTAFNGGRLPRAAALASSDEPAVARGESAILQLLKEGLEEPARRFAPDLPNVSADERGQAERQLLTLVFTDIVSSTERLESLGDKGWCSLLMHHHNLVRSQLGAFHGREIDSAGDGFFLAFDRPGRAVEFAAAIRRALKPIGIDLRVGIHTGECEVVGRRVEGVAVHTAARVANAAAAGEILVSSTVRDLVAGSEHHFIKRDLVILKGLSEPRRLFALEMPERSS